ncbi:MAG: hypothetical protein ACOC1O_03670 [bacterium]
MLKPRMKTSIIMGVLLGVFCIIGVVVRFGYKGNAVYLLAMWYNRLLMGIVIGLLADRKKIIVLLRGAILGLLVSLAFFISTEFWDPVGFLAGIGYGVIIDYVATNYSHIVKKSKLTDKVKS